MALVGDFIVQMRERGPDPCKYLPTPTLPAPTPANAGGSLLSATYYAVVTTVNQWGESAPTTEAAIVVTGGTGVNGQITFSPTFVAGGQGTGYRIYIVATTPGAESGYIFTTGTGPTTVTTLANLIPGVPPVQATGMMPDTDGGFVSAWTCYRWLNDAMTLACKVGGGVLDVYGLQAITGQAYYRLPGQWIKLTNIWFDGWPVTAGKRGDVFLHNVMNSIPGLVSMENYQDSTVFQLWPQTNRTGNTQVLSVQLNAPDVQATVTAMGASVLPMGLLQVDNEIMAYTGVSGNIFQNLMRGLGGTLAAVHLVGATVTELNIRIAGFRMVPDFSVGQAAVNVPVPPGWDQPISDYLSAQFKAAEQNDQVNDSMEKEFINRIAMMAKGSKTMQKPIQIGSITRETYPGGFSGGLLIP